MFLGLLDPDQIKNTGNYYITVKVPVPFDNKIEKKFSSFGMKKESLDQKVEYLFLA